MTKPTKRMCAQQDLKSASASTKSDQSLLSAQWVGKGKPNETDARQSSLRSAWASVQSDLNLR